MRALALAAVAVLAAPVPAFRLDDPRITEASGIAAGVRSPGVVYVQNDSGDTARFFAVDRRTGATAAVVTVAGATNVDWEDLAVARGPGGASETWLADIGDNDAARHEVGLYRVREPRIRPGDRDRAVVTAPAAVWRLAYPDGPTDAEGLAVAPGGTAYVVTKSPFGTSRVYQVPPHPDAGHVQRLRLVGTIALVPHGVANPFGVVGELAVTGAAISPDGSLFAVRTYAEAYTWRLGRGGLAAALRTAPVRVALPWQPQGEGIALPDDRHALVDSEGGHSPVYSVALPELPRAAPTPAPTPASTSGARSTPPRSSSASRAAGRSGPSGWLLGGVVGAAALALIVLAAALRRRH